jgi:hypothetical protein
MRFVADPVRAHQRDHADAALRQPAGVLGGRAGYRDAVQRDLQPEQVQHRADVLLDAGVQQPLEQLVALQLGDLGEQHLRDVPTDPGEPVGHYRRDGGQPRVDGGLVDSHRLRIAT